MTTQDYFNLLGIPPTKDKEVIKKAYRKMAFQFHPDHNNSENANQKFIAINEAYEQIIIALEKLEAYPSSSSKSNEVNYTIRYRRATREEKIEFAKNQYEKIRQREIEEDEAFFQKITSGVRWKIFKAILFTSSLLFLVLIFDLFIFKEAQEIVFFKEMPELTNDLYYKTTFTNGKSGYLPKEFLLLNQNSPLLIETTSVFQEIKNISSVNTGDRIFPLFSVITIYPFLFIAFMLPFLAMLIKGKTPFFSFFYYLSMYVVPIILLLFLLTKHRWLHLLTLGAI